MFEIILLVALSEPSSKATSQKPTSRLSISKPKWVAPIVSAPKASSAKPRGPDDLSPDLDAEIMGGAILEWPDDFVMQRHTYKQQKEAWFFVQRYWNRSLPPRVEKLILAKAREEWPLDYVMQKFTIERQAAAYLGLDD